MTQFNAGDILLAINKSTSKSAFCTLAVTNRDLYPPEEGNFVFGLADMHSQTGVFSFA